MRNARMVRAAVEMQIHLGVKVDVHAFPTLRSRGTHDCYDQAAAAGLYPIMHPKPTGD